MNYKITDMKKFPSSVGIYSISFLNSKKVYIGSASKISAKHKSNNGFYGRWRHHIYFLSKNKHPNKHLQMAYNKYGESNMIFSILEVCNVSDCISKEQFYINKYNSYNDGYNLRPFASNNNGYKHSDKQKTLFLEKFKSSRDMIFPEIRKLYESGKNTREISLIVNKSRGLISKILKENNIKIRNDKGCKKKEICQYDINGNLLSIYDSIYKCACELGISRTGIRNVLEGKNNSFHNYIFKYK